MMASQGPGGPSAVSPAQARAQLPGKDPLGLAPGKNEDLRPGVLVSRGLEHEVARRPEAGEPQGLPVAKAREPERSPADGPGAEKRCGLGVGKNLRDGVGKGLGDGHVLGVPAVCVTPRGPETGAEVFVAAEAVATGPAGRKDPGNPHSRPDGETLRPGAILHDPADNLVARDDRKPGRGGSPLDLVELRVAHAAGRNPDQGLPLAWHGHRELHETQRSHFSGEAHDPVDNHRFHHKTRRRYPFCLPAVPDTDYSPAGAVFHAKKRGECPARILLVLPI